MTEEAIQRIVLVLEYDGAPWCGWQRQRNGTAVQALLDRALVAIDGTPPTTVAAGRTDAGVHALAMAVHADVDRARWRRAPGAYLHGVNAHLPESVRVVAIRAVEAGFHARFDCLQRRYRYRIWNRSAAPSALERWRHWWMPRPLDLEAMRAAAACLLGEHDFSAFRAAGCQARHAVRRIDALEIARSGHEIRIEIAADAFLYHMVRTIVGTLVECGTGRRPPETIPELLAGGERSQAGPNAPAHGLYFIDARYRDFSSAALAGGWQR
ncbi:MAG: tRNA pseudouridine(38-40) synthase TruA [Zetaproteobacteria bacterium]|nr:MAG: tRNA pseudouridine(38-40) synthase TruA [Zetaproteobacteria bacterium]